MLNGFKGTSERLVSAVRADREVRGRVIGSTRYMNIEKTHHRAEIGCTWIGREWQRHGGEYGVEIPAAATCIERWNACGWS